jgi:hypothetical protein
MIYCIGDSFTYGSELPDVINLTHLNKVPSIYAWPSLLEKKLSSPVINLGKEASGPTRMIKRAMDCVFNGDADIIIIAWPRFDRIEWADSKGIFDIWPGRNIERMPVERHSIIKNITSTWSDELDHWIYRCWLRDIILLQTFFKQHNQKYIMLQSHYSQHFNKKWIDVDTNLFQFIDTTYFLGWPYESMMEWTFGTPQGPYGHFLEQGHEIVTDKIYEYIRHLGWIS